MGIIIDLVIKGGGRMEIYLDLVLIENFIVDMFLILITCKLISVNVNGKRLLLSSFIGAIYSITMVIEELIIFTLLPIQLFVAFFMISLLLKESTIKIKLKGMGVYILSAITLSGMCFCFSMCQNVYSLYEGFTINNYSIKYLIISIMIIYIVYERAHSYFKERIAVTSFMYDIELLIDGVKYIIRGFLDTGNELREPITNLPCIIIEEDYISNFKMVDESMYYIPYSAIGYSGKLKGFKVDKVRIRRESDEWREIEAIICPCREVLSRDREFNALLSRGVV